MSEALKVMMEYGKDNGISLVITRATQDNVRLKNILKREVFSLRKSEKINCFSRRSTADS